MPDRILVVDDEEPIREIVASMLGAAGYACKQAGSGMEALAVLTSGEEFELMLSDLMMADLDGIGLLERTKERYPDMPVVMVTAVHDISVALAAIRNGAYDYLLKPFEREQLLNTVSRALENRRLKVENRTYQTNLESLVKARTDQLQAAIRELERSYDITLQALGDALDLKDRETEGHSQTRNCLHDGDRPRHGVAQGADRHHRPRRFSARYRKDGHPRQDPEQAREARSPERSPSCGSTASRAIRSSRRFPSSKKPAEIVYSHQEHFDGSGYPRGTEGERDSAGGANILRCGHARRHYFRPRLPAGQIAAAAREEIQEVFRDASLILRWSSVSQKCRTKSGKNCGKEIHNQTYRASYTTGARG